MTESIKAFLIELQTLKTKVEKDIPFVSLADYRSDKDDFYLDSYDKTLNSLFETAALDISMLNLEQIMTLKASALNPLRGKFEKVFDLLCERPQPAPFKDGDKSYLGFNDQVFLRRKLYALFPGAKPPRPANVNIDFMIDLHDIVLMKETYLEKFLDRLPDLHSRVTPKGADTLKPSEKDSVGGGAACKIKLDQNDLAVILTRQTEVQLDKIKGDYSLSTAITAEIAQLYGVPSKSLRSRYTYLLKAKDGTYLTKKRHEKIQPFIQNDSKAITLLRDNAPLNPA